METQFSFKGKHFRELGIRASVKTKSRPILPEAKKQELEAAVMHGAYDFTECNHWGHAMYKDRVFELKVSIGADTIQHLIRDVTKLANWLNGSGELVFDDMPHVIWDAYVWDGVNFEPVKSGHRAEIDVSFKVKPFSRYKYSMADDILLGDNDVTLSRDIPLGAFADLFMFEATTQSASFIVNNIGSVPARPKIIIGCISDTNGGNAGNVSTDSIDIYKNGLTKLELSRRGTKHIVIDNDNMSVTDGSTSIINECTIGIEDFLELDPGDNEITIRLSKALKWAARFEFTPLYLFDTNDWGD